VIRRDGSDRQRVQSGPHALFRLADRLVRQSDERKMRHARRQRALHLDQAGLDALERHRIAVRNHAAAVVRPTTLKVR